MEFPFRLGVQVSIAGGIERAVLRAKELGCTAMQIFSRNPRGWRARPLSPRSLDAFRAALVPGEIDPVVVHTPYLVNLSAADEALFRQSVVVLALEIRRAEQLGARFVVTHLGSAKAKGKGWALNRVINALKIVLARSSKVRLLLENSAGGGNCIGASLEEMGEVLEGVGRDDRLGVCFDSCHGFAAGYDFRSPEKTGDLVRKIDQTLGRKRLALLHLNDCNGALGSHLDRHQHIGHGKIGIEGFRSLLSDPLLRNLPMILETPKKSDRDDRRNLSRVRKILKEVLSAECRGEKNHRKG